MTPRARAVLDELWRETWEDWKKLDMTLRIAVMRGVSEDALRAVARVLIETSVALAEYEK